MKYITKKLDFSNQTLEEMHLNSKKFYNLIKKRRSVRDFKNDEVDFEIIKNAIISYHLNLFINHLCVAAVNTKMPINEVIITNNPCQILSIPIKSSSWLNKNTIGRIPVRKLYQKD